MRRNANSARNLFAPVKIGEEMLAEALACHGGNSVARGARSAPRGNEVRRSRGNEITKYGRKERWTCSVTIGVEWRDPRCGERGTPSVAMKGVRN
jgi:hypothetical protein